MTEPQQQEYIITEDMLRWWRNQCIAEPAHTDTDQCKKCKYRGKGSRNGCCDFDDDAMEKIFRSRPHTPAAPADLRDGMEIRFRTKREAWEQGYQDGESAVQHDLNLIKDAAAKAEREQVLDEFIELWQTNFCVFPKKKCSQDDGSNYCPVCIAKSLRGGGAP